MTTQPDAMAASLARDGFSPDEIANMLNPSTQAEPLQLRWGLDDVMHGDDDSVIVMLSGPGGEPYWLELDQERAAALRQSLASPVETQQDKAKPVLAYGGKGRVWCVKCPRPTGEDVPFTAGAVDPWELCASCGRHVIDVAEAQQDGARP